MRRRPAATAAVVVVVVVVLCGWLSFDLLGAQHAPGRATRSPAAPAPRSTVVAPPSTTVATTTSTTADPGALAQTTALPSTDTAQFGSEMAALWRAITDDAPSEAMPAFFPAGAYLQLKTIPGAASDYQDRLVGDFDLDIGAAHASLGNGAATATLVGVQVLSAYAHWVPPGECDNGVGYFEVANSRLVFSASGVTRSIGIASLISWRGVWYVVHLGAILRGTDTGVVLDPQVGPGVSAPSTTC